MSTTLMTDPAGTGHVSAVLPALGTAGLAVLGAFLATRLVLRAVRR